MNMDPYKRMLLFRAAHGKSMLSRYKAKLGHLLVVNEFDASLLSLPETDSLIDELRKKREVMCERIDFASLAECLGFASTIMSAHSYYLLMDEDWKYCGAYTAASNTPLRVQFDFDRYCSDEIRLINTELSMQVSIDYEECRGVGAVECYLRKYE
ncbi:hypothetical protein [Pseudomonas purpurea]|uniref:hypothetical protein n=1 Tax=Pseudomonas purpurea TaxID=3136737 RepID=UPI003262CFE2